MNRTHRINRYSACICVYKATLLILTCAMVFCAYVSLFLTKAYNTVVLSIGIFVYFMLILAVYDIATNMPEHILRNIGIGMLITMAVGLLLIGLNIKSARQTDLIHLHYAAINYLENGSFGDVAAYFNVYPYQRNLVYILVGVFKLGRICGIADYRTSGTVFGAMCLLLSALITYKIANRLGNRKLGICVLLIMLSNPIIYLNASYYYTDIVATPFFVGVLYMAIWAEEKSGWVRIFRFSLLGFVTYTGMQIRSTVGIAAIAVLLCLWSVDGKRAIKTTIFFVLGILPSYCMWKMLTIQMGGTLNPDMAFPITHWIMMGMNPENNGKYSSAMYSYTDSLPTHSQKILGNLGQLSCEIQEMGVSGLFGLLLTKLKCIWSDGMTGIYTNLKCAVQYGKLWEYTVGKKSFVTGYIAQIMRCTSLLCLVPGLIAFKRKCKTIEMAIPVSMFGYMLFYLFWEVHERYVFMFLPVMFLISAIGVVFVHQEFCIKRPYLQREEFICGRKDNKTVYFVVKRTVLITQIITILIAVFYSKNMIGAVADRYETRLNQPTRNTSSVISSVELIQSFSLDQPFNRVSVQFIKDDDVLDGQQYLFTLLEDDRILYQQTFLSEDIKDNSGYFMNFSFDTISPQKMTQYKIKLTAVDNYENSISVCHTKRNTRNYYDNGEFTENGIEDGDLTFRIEQKSKGTLISKRVFYMLLVGSLLLEMFLYCWAQWHTRRSQPRGYFQVDR